MWFLDLGIYRRNIIAYLKLNISVSPILEQNFKNKLQMKQNIRVFVILEMSSN